MVCTLILRVDSEMAAADWSAEDTRGFCRHWGLGYTIHTHGCAELDVRLLFQALDVLSHIISSLGLSRDIHRRSDNFKLV